MLKKILVLTAAIMAAMVLFAGPAATQGYPPAVFNASIDDTTVTPGQTVTISGTCEAGDEVVVAIVGEGTIGTIPVNADDTFSGPITIPDDLDPGTYTVTATCGDAEVLSIEITVLGDDGGPGNGDNGDDDGVNGGNNNGGGNNGGDNDDALARTGSPTETLLKVGGGLLLAGAAATLFATKRRSVTA